MVQAFDGKPDLLVQYKMVDQYKGIAEAQEKMLEHIQLGNVTIYGDSNTGAQFAKSFIEHFTPGLDIVQNGFKDKFKEVFGLNKKTEELPKSEDQKPEEGKTFEEVK
jgi:flotillin